MADDEGAQHNSHVYCFRSHVEDQIEKEIEARRQFFIDSVWREVMTPAQAEEDGAAEAIGIADLTLSTALDSPRWSLAQAVLWVAWRDPDRVMEQWRRLHAWSGDLWRDPPGKLQVETFEQAEARLWAELEVGRVRATGLSGQGPRPVQIEAVEWTNLVWMTDKTRLSVRYFGESNEAYRCVDVRGADMLAVWSAPGMKPPEAVEETRLPDDVGPRKRGGGRPTVHDWAAAAGFSAWFIAENDYPPVESDLTSILTRWFGEQRDKVPDQRDVQRFVSTIYEERRVRLQK